MESAAKYTKRLMQKGARANKALGQNFLIDDKVIEQIVAISTLYPDLPLVEIGPGLGVLTRELAQRVNKLWAVELDRSKIDILNLELKAWQVEVIEADALKLDLRELWGEQKGFLVGNLPYYITSPLLMHFLAQSDVLAGMTVMVQKEVADRLVARPGGKEYGVLSIAVQTAAAVERVMDVPAQAFLPAPKVNSAVLKFTVRTYPGLEVEREELMRVVKAAFSQRRKTLGNSLSAGLSMDKAKVVATLQRSGIVETRRAETLSIEEFQTITNALA